MRQRLIFTLVVYLVNKVFITLPALYAVSRNPALLKHKSLLSFLLVENLSRWDSTWYAKIARTGYDLYTAAFFPLYPFLMRLFSHWTHLGIIQSGILISNVCFLMVLWFAYGLFRVDFNERETKRIIWLMALFPTSYYFSAVYTESLFALFCVWMLYAMRTQTWWASGVSGFFASMARTMGVFLAVPFAFDYFGILRLRDLLRIHQKLRRNWGQFLWVVFIPLGLGVYMAYLHQRFGDPLAFSHAEHFWHRSFHNPMGTIVYGLQDYSRYILHPDWKWKMFGYTLTHSLWVLALIGMILWSLFSLRISYWLVLVYSLLIPLSSPNFQGADYFMSITRYTLVVIPLYIALYLMLRRAKWLYMSFLTASSLFLMDLVYLWTVNAGFIA
ncbi:mannosyltransferase family protein [Alicyclobacillus mengziensis]|uniref:Mannosyltransferase PIG-V n=1 Tax=Alicyclobacillus mengziensis TaxID=2931921 RepID=A0A9X7VW18_9BACL|nr:mannosyltransferase family protein [Alicyclobacillus mengziensis]QSO45567.1 hypothetical protein JZ786_13400 [Alicyclobacillus mengziensis]